MSDTKQTHAPNILNPKCEHVQIQCGLFVVLSFKCSTKEHKEGTSKIQVYLGWL